MQLLKKRGLLIFWLILLLDCYFIYSGEISYRIFTKPLLVPVLTFHIFLNARQNYYHNTKTFVFLALIFAWIGDILLLNTGMTYFFFGMLAFACTHVLFSVIFYRIHRLELAKCQEAFIASLLVIFVYSMLYRYVNAQSISTRNFHSYRVPVIAFMVVLGMMSILAANLLSSSLRKLSAINYFIPGVILFVLSDSVLLLQVFVFPEVDFLGIIVMLSYGYALALICDGFSKILKG